MRTDQRFVSVNTFSKMFDYSPDHIRRMIRTGALPAKRIYGQGSWRIDLSLVQFESNELEMPAPKTRKALNRQVDITEFVNNL